MSRRRRRTRREGGASAPPARFLILDNRFSPPLERPEAFRAWRGYTPPVAPYRPPPPKGRLARFNARPSCKATPHSTSLDTYCAN